MTIRTPTKAPPRRNTIIEIVIAVGGSLLGTWLTDQLDGSPSLKLTGAVLGALTPALLAEILPKRRARPAVALGIAAVAVALTYIGVTAADFATQSPPTFPQVPGAPSPSGTTTDTRGGLKIAVSPARLSCDTNGCRERVTVHNAGDRPLRVGDIEVDGRDAAAFTADPDAECRNHTLPGNGDDCAFTVVVSPSAAAGAVEARLVIHQNLPGDPTFVPISGEGTGGPVPDPADDPTDDPQPQPGLNLTLSVDNVECAHQRAGTVGGKDALQVFVAVNVTMGSVNDLPGLVPVRASSDTGAAANFSTAIGSGVVVAIPLRPTDYARTLLVTITVDPADRIQESDETDNRIVVRVPVPPRPTASTTSLNCVVL